MENKNYTELNAKAIDKWAEGGWEWSIPTSHDEYLNAKSGKWGVVLTPQITVPAEWFAPYLQDSKLTGVKILGLACGGGQQMPIFAALGADCTVLDYSDRQLESEKMVSEREGYTIKIVKADMTKRLPFDNDSFDMIFHPVSNCYIEDVYHVWNECYRVLKKGGVLLAGLDNGINFMFDDVYESPLILKNKLPYNPLKDAELFERSYKTDSSIQFSHSLEEQIGGQLKAGLVLTDLFEDRDKADLLSEYCPQYIATRSVKP